MSDYRALRWEASTGPVTLNFPAELSLDDVNDLQQLLAQWIAVMRRIATKTESEE